MLPFLGLLPLHITQYQNISQELSYNGTAVKLSPIRASQLLESHDEKEKWVLKAMTVLKLFTIIILVNLCREKEICLQDLPD